MIRQGTDLLKEAKSNRVTITGKLERVDFLDTRVYKRSEELYYPSVTSILQYMPKNKFFETWMKEVGFNADIIMEKAGKEGTQVHEAIEKLVQGEEIRWVNDMGIAQYNQLVWEMILKFKEFWDEAKPKTISTEEFVYSDSLQYAGTMDLLVEIEGEVWLVDIKTSNSLHKSYDLQLAAYVKAYEEMYNVKIDRTGILWLKSAKRGASKQKDVIQGKGWELKPVDSIEENFELFQCVYKLFSIENPKVEPLIKQYPTSIKL